MLSILKFFPTIDNGTYTSVDFNVNIVIPEEVISNNRVEYISIPDDTRLDLISYQYYSTYEYVDLIMLINKITSVFDLPKSSTYLETYIITKHAQTISKLPGLTTVQSNNILEDIRKKAYLDNELYRNLIIIKPKYISDTIKAIKDANFL